MKINRLASLLLGAFSLLTVFASPVKAQYGCPGQYGQYGSCPPSQAILVDKFVGKTVVTSKGGLTDIEYVDNLSSSDPRFKPGNQVAFKVKVKNTSNTTLSNVTVKDFVPAYLEPIEGPGSYDSASRTITFNAGDFAVNEEKVYYLKMQFASQGNLPPEQGLICVVNKVNASTNGISDEDAAQVCVEKQVTGVTPGVTQVPQAGPEMGALLLTGQFLALGAGIFLKRKFSA